LRKERVAPPTELHAYIGDTALLCHRPRSLLARLGKRPLLLPEFTHRYPEHLGLVAFHPLLASTDTGAELAAEVDRPRYRLLLRSLLVNVFADAVLVVVLLARLAEYEADH